MGYLEFRCAEGKKVDISTISIHELFSWIFAQLLMRDYSTNDFSEGEAFVRYCYLSRDCPGKVKQYDSNVAGMDFLSSFAEACHMITKGQDARKSLLGIKDQDNEEARKYHKAGSYPPKLTQS
jgi:hypothetical protein